MVIKLVQIEELVRQAERKAFSEINKRASTVHSTLPIFFDTSGPHHPVYHATPVHLLLKHVSEEISLPRDIEAAVFGSGLGASATALALWVKRVTLFEIDPLLLDLSKEVLAAAGLDNADFVAGDFLDVAVKLDNFGAVYFYNPFSDDCPQIMSQRLLATAPGTYAISHQMSVPVFHDPQHFTLVHPPANGEQQKLLLSEFYTAIRK